jgi:hypothetical protein
MNTVARASSGRSVGNGEGVTVTDGAGVGVISFVGVGSGVADRGVELAVTRLTGIVLRAAKPSSAVSGVGVEALQEASARINKVTNIIPVPKIFQILAWFNKERRTLTIE